MWLMRHSTFLPPVPYFEECRQYLIEQGDQFRIKVLAAVVFDIYDGFLYVPCMFVRTPRGQRIEYIGERHDTRFNRYSLAFQAERISTAIPFFVMVERNVFRHGHQPWRTIAEDICTDDGMLLHDREFFIRQFAG